jgi:uncharacterized protein YodC (DUF2158 family)
MSLNNGDIVILKSGGPRMTVLGTSSSNVSCGYFIGDQFQLVTSLSTEALDVIKAAEVAPVAPGVTE